ncbi:MAG: class I SAM-dependent RNA methyltransferase [Acidimicrobiia bacterium]
MLELHPSSMAHGGEAVARHDGKAHFIAGAMPGEVVLARVTEDRGSWARTSVVEIVEPSPERRTPPCPHALVCGGCQWQFANIAEQREWKRDIVASQLSHIGRISEPTVHQTVAAGPELGYRTRMDFHVVEGRAGLMRSRSNDVVPLDDCPLLHPTLQPVFASLGDLTGVDRITLRTGIRTGRRLAVIDGAIPSQAESWGIPVAQMTGKKARGVIGDAVLDEIVADTLFTIPIAGFFQNNTDGADSLVALAGAAADLQPGETLFDGYCGVGLFGATVGKDADLVLGMDTGRAAVDFARRNLTAAGVEHHYVTGSVTKDIESLDAYWDVAIVDPPRKGLGGNGIDAVTSSMPRRIVYVSCDPASLARDARALGEIGYDFIEATPVDMFPQTFHVEVVATFDRRPFEVDVD